MYLPVVMANKVKVVWSRPHYINVLHSGLRQIHNARNTGWSNGNQRELQQLARQQGSQRHLYRQTIETEGHKSQKATLCKRAPKDAIQEDIQYLGGGRQTIFQ